MKENLKTRLDRVEEVTMPAKRKSIHEYSDEELEEIIAEWEAENVGTSTNKLLEIIRDT